jgi:sulfane dehydrogenase subunit SoxC
VRRLAAFLFALLLAPAADAGTQRVTIRTDDGASLAGTWYEPGVRQAPAVILVHMLHRTRHDWDPVATRLASEGIGALAIDLRGHGESSGGAEGGDAAKLSRSIPIEKAWDDALIVYAFNGEPLRPANGYPVRLLLPGFEANTCVKWLRRIKLVDEPNMSRDETAKYTDPLPDGTARQFSFVMDAKSIITRPAAPSRIERGWHEISGLAWSGRGKIARVDVSTDGGKSWIASQLQEPILPKAHTRFRLMWEWDGRAATLMSRAVDETGYVQPTLATFEAGRGPGTDFHFNHIRSWIVNPDGVVQYGVGL